MGKYAMDAVFYMSTIDRVDLSNTYQRVIVLVLLLRYFPIPTAIDVGNIKIAAVDAILSTS